jgi:polyhydroxyalkanoate synthesis regulator phasin
MAEPAESDKGKQPSRGDAVRAAAAQAIHAAGGQAQLTRDRAQELADELAGVAVRVRDALDELRQPSSEELKALRADLAALEARVKTLEDAAAKPKKRAPARKSAPKKRGAASS